MRALPLQTIRRRVWLGRALGLLLAVAPPAACRHDAAAASLTPPPLLDAPTASSVLPAPESTDEAAQSVGDQPNSLGEESALPAGDWRLATAPSAWSFLGLGPRRNPDPALPQRPHPAVARIVVPEGMATSYGSGTLIDARDKFGLVVTNWHVVRDAKDVIEVIFPGGFRSKARALKVDPDWDLAALVIWRPNAEPAKIAAEAPQPGDTLTICGYGQGQYRAATGRCTQYYAPRIDFPQQMVELDVEARQGDSGGPIFNDRGELAGVLFGAGQGTTLGSFGGRVESFLATLAPNIGRAADEALVDASSSDRNEGRKQDEPLEESSNHASSQPRGRVASRQGSATLARRDDIATKGESSGDQRRRDGRGDPRRGAANEVAAAQQPGVSWFGQMKSVLAAIGVVALVVQLLRAVR